MLRRLLPILLCLFWAVPAMAAGQLPQGRTQFITASGAPCASCKVYFYIPGTTTPKDTWQDADQSTLNANPVILDSLGSAVIFGTGTYRQILTDSTDQTLWDQPISDPVSLNAGWGGMSGGSANVLTLTVGNYSAVDGQIIYFLSQFSNSAATTMNVNGLGAVEIVKDTAAGPVSLGGGELITGNVAGLLYSSTTGQFHLITPTPVLSFDGPIYFNGAITPTIIASDQDDYTPPGNYAGANTLRLSSSSNVNITGLAGGSSGRTLIVHNIGSFNITLPTGSTSSSAANRFAFPGPITLRPNDDVVIQYDALSSLWRKWSPQSAFPVASSFKNLLLVNGGTPNSQVTGTADSFTLQDSNGTTIRRSSLNCTASTATTGVRGLDSGGVANNTLYSYWFIYSPSANADACLFSTSATAPTLPSGYTFYGRAGWNRTDGSANLYRVRQVGSRATYVVTSATNTAALPVLATGTTGSVTVPTWSSIPVVGSIVPTTASTILVVGGANGNGAAVIGAPNNAYSGTASITNAPPLALTLGASGFGTAGTGTTVTAYVEIPLESSNIYWASSGSGNFLSTTGWIDTLP